MVKVLICLHATRYLRARKVKLAMNTDRILTSQGDKNQ